MVNTANSVLYAYVRLFALAVGGLFAEHVGYGSPWAGSVGQLLLPLVRNTH